MVYNGGHVLLIVMIITGLILSFGGGYYTSRNIENSNLQKTNVELQESLEKIKKALPEIKEIRSFEGTVRSVGENTITLEVAPSSNPFDEWPVIREVTITPETKILHRGVKSPETLQKEFEAGKKTASAFFQEEMPINDLKPGWKITVEAGENIKTKTSFRAVRVLNDWPFSGLPSDLPGITPFPVAAPAVTGAAPLSTNLPTPPPSIPSGGVIRPSILPTPPPAPLSSPILAPAVPIPSGTPVPGNLPPTPPLSLPSVPPLPSGTPPSVLPTPPL